MFGSQEEEQQERTERKRDIQSVTDWMSGVIRGEATRTFEVGSLQFEATTTTECLDVQCLDTSQPDARLNRSSYLKISFSPADFEPWVRSQMPSLKHKRIIPIPKVPPKPISTED
ncbi:hypothetical protein A3K24_00340 [candidate division Kazan bacterium RIFCSPHIGHO2_01_FULL_44_14]|uniref:Uncharacterized protein n=1 Tax=candidate division Kazan bacterium RIFCSPLOWO2_01_FULL_45_19 TaxID=1798538 RepID=A0A1F4NPM2_UNCK3|nr:MAG: hypothetical protein A3K51_00340 [candidate division Kazan bacterium RIFCSPLOWO2_01_FULL_45_19]OGB77561.1 MAG: hypothetical protein A3K24_00340 [candidate division Kazan bacterium RIFCSPHIGHO2_01_FULL_44_14]